MDALTELGTLLRPAGGGVYLVSTGKAEQQALQRRLYGAATSAEIEARWHAALARIATARAVILGVPSDVGAGYRRGANLGPAALRAGLLAADPDWPARAEAWGVVDLGDVFVVPQLLHDDMLSAAQRDASARALYPRVADDVRARLPVSPLSIEARALALVLQLNPNVIPIILGGDHSVAWPVAEALAARPGDERWGIVQPDAHTDLMIERLGVKYCFATWTHHANQLLGADGRVVQLGIRATGSDRSTWESVAGVRQFWADECLKRPAGVLDDLVAHLRALGVTSVYFSNDIDGTDERWADATGTPEPGGLTPTFLVDVIRRLGREFRFCAADVVEVAPPLGKDGSATVALGVRYLRETIAAALGEPPPDEPLPIGSGRSGVHKGEDLMSSLERHLEEIAEGRGTLVDVEAVLALLGDDWSPLDAVRSDWLDAAKDQLAEPPLGDEARAHLLRALLHQHNHQDELAALAYMMAAGEPPARALVMEVLGLGAGWHPEHEERFYLAHAATLVDPCARACFLAHVAAVHVNVGLDDAAAPWMARAVEAAPDAATRTPALRAYFAEHRLGYASALIR